MRNLAYLPGDVTDAFVALSDSTRGKVFEKHILSTGPLFHPKAPGGRVNIDEDFLDRMVANFNAGVCPIVQIPLADSQNRHSEDPSRNIGRVIGLSRRGGKLFAQMDVRKREYVDEIGSTLLGASALLDINAIDRRTQKAVGPTVYHVCVTNRPHVTDLDEFSEVLAMSNATTDEAIMLSASNDEETPMDLETAINYLRDEHQIDVPALQRASEANTAAVALSDEVRTALGESGLVDLSAGDSVDVVASVRAAGERLVALSAEVEETKSAAARAAAETEVDGLIKEGRVLPKQRDIFITLSQTDRDSFTALVPDEAVIALSAEQGSDVTKTDDEAAQAEVERLSALARTR